MKKRNLKFFPFIIRDEDKFKGIKKSYFWEGAVADYFPKPIGLQSPYAISRRAFVNPLNSEELFSFSNILDREKHKMTVEISDYIISKGIFNLDLVFIQTKENKFFALEFQFTNQDWLFIKNDGLILRINDSKNLKLEAIEVNTDVGGSASVIMGFGDNMCVEKGLIPLSPEILKEICDADSIQIQVTGKKGTIELTNQDFLKPRFCDPEILEDEYCSHCEKIDKKWETTIDSIRGIENSIHKLQQKHIYEELGIAEEISDSLRAWEEVCLIDKAEEKKLQESKRYTSLTVAGYGDTLIKENDWVIVTMTDRDHFSLPFEGYFQIGICSELEIPEHALVTKTNPEEIIEWNIGENSHSITIKALVESTYYAYCMEALESCRKKRKNPSSSPLEAASYSFPSWKFKSQHPSSEVLKTTFSNQYLKNGLTHSLIFTTRCMYHAFIDQSAYADEVNAHVNWIKEEQYKYFPESNPYSQWEKISALAQEEKVKSFLPQKYWNSLDKIKGDISSHEEDLQKIEDISRQWDELNNTCNEQKKALSKKVKSIGSFSKELGISAYEMVQSGHDDDLLKPLIKIHKELGTLSGADTKSPELTKFLTRINKRGNKSEPLTRSKKIELLEEWLLKNRKKGDVKSEKWAEFDKLNDSLKEFNSSLEKLSAAQTEMTEAHAILEKAETELEKSKKSLEIFYYGAGKDLYELVSLGVEDPLLLDLSEIHLEMQNAIEKIAELDEAEGFLNKAKAMAESLLLKGKLTLLETNLESEYLKSGRELLETKREEELLENAALKNKIKEKRKLIEKKESEVLQKEKSLESIKKKLAKRLKIESVPSNGFRDLMDDNSDDRDDCLKNIEKWKKNTALEILEPKALDKELKSKITTLNKQLSGSFLSTGREIIDQKREEEFISDRTLKKKIKKVRDEINLLETELSKEKKELSRKEKAFMKMLKISSISESSFHGLIATKKTELEGLKTKFEQWKKDITIIVVDAGEKKWPPKGPLREFLNSM